VNWQLIIKIKNADSITLITAPLDQTYKVGNSMLIVAVPKYSWYPTQSHTVFVTTKISGPSCVSIYGSPNTINIYTTDTTATGNYVVTIQTTETNSGLSDVRSFNLVIQCVSSIAISTSLTDVIYYIADSSIIRTPSYNLTPSTCPYELILTVTLSDGSPLPSSIQYNAPSIYVYTATYALKTAYTVKIVATDPKTGVTNSGLTLNVFIRCTKTIDVTLNPIPASTIYTLDPNNLNSITLYLPTYARTPSACPYSPTW
jgi:hypothetical protein